MINTFIYYTDYGKITISEENEYIIEMKLGYSHLKDADLNIKESDIIKKAYKQLMEYFNGQRKSFDLPLNPKGTEFQKKVWNALLNIPYGSTCSYKDIAVNIGNEKACRAVGGANNKNPIFIIIPCHRVIGKNGSLVGYGGGLDIKLKLLELEQNNMKKRAGLIK